MATASSIFWAITTEESTNQLLRVIKTILIDVIGVRLHGLYAEPRVYTSAIYDLSAACDPFLAFWHSAPVYTNPAHSRIGSVDRGFIFILGRQCLGVSAMT
ncbi:hypothetical protein BD410DRAFT_807621 [Rickenella mellea]|uniref:Uncharacterized protein n=1 Tax=Rickenella mellea TaxID=50990 RepID=A0A4Y7PR87_9AGAM|nr:hypothetical protein BD410DRAFT_807621 [Rickenella mellea]